MAAGVACPNCNSKNFSRKNYPVDWGEVTFRRHQCRNCRHVFVTEQAVISNPLADQIMNLIEPPISASQLTQLDTPATPEPRAATTATSAS